MQVLTDKDAISKFYASLEADTDGGNFALINAQSVLRIEHAFTSDNEEIWYLEHYLGSDTHTVVDYKDIAEYMQKGFFTLSEVVIYKTEQSALNDYLSRIYEGVKQYFNVCP